ncbi:MAG: AAA family ATPase [Saprospiraceae bacterium]|nr:AAA family ATPase [Saprospiraceae bacterium]
MIKHLKISHFKSIREMELDCKRVNVFIGEPNKGKTNILEALSLLSKNLPERFADTFRFTDVLDLFYDFNAEKPIRVSIDNYEGQLFYKLQKNKFGFFERKDGINEEIFSVDIKGHWDSYSRTSGLPILFYKFNGNLDSFNGEDISGLTPPDGNNIPLLLYSNPYLKKIISDFIEENGYHLGINPAKREITLSKIMGKDVLNYPYVIVSETIKRIIFLMLAIESNKNSTLLFDEPEAHTFPFYTKYIAERIALDTTNQYFLTTHNPYLLSSIISKTPTEDLSVGVVYMDNYETKIHIIQPDQYEELTDADVFYNLEHLTEA